MLKLNRILNRIRKKLAPYYYRAKETISSLPKQAKETDILPVSISKITLQDGFVHTYTDGSCSYNNKLLGLGVVMPTNDKHTRIIFSKRVKLEPDYNLQRFGAMRSEFMATTYAMQALPEGTNVHIYTDHPILRRVLNRHIAGRKMLWTPRNQDKHSPEFVEMIHNLRAELQTMGEIQVTRLNDSLSRRMELAHKAAAQGSGAKGIKARLAKKPPPTRENTLSMEDPRDFNDPRDDQENATYNPSNPLDRMTFD